MQITLSPRIARTHTHQISLFAIRFRRNNTCARWVANVEMVYRLFRLSPRDVQLLNSVRTKFICKISIFIQFIGFRSKPHPSAGSIEFLWTAPHYARLDAAAAQHSQSSPHEFASTESRRRGRQFITNTLWAHLHDTMCRRGARYFLILTDQQRIDIQQRNRETDASLVCIQSSILRRFISFFSSSSRPARVVCRVCARNQIKTQTKRANNRCRLLPEKCSSLCTEDAVGTIDDNV